MAVTDLEHYRQTTELRDITPARPTDGTQPARQVLPDHPSMGRSRGSWVHEAHIIYNAVPAQAASAQAEGLAPGAYEQFVDALSYVAAIALKSSGLGEIDPLAFALEDDR